MESLVLDGSYSLMMTSGAFIASAPTVNLDTKFGGAKGFFSGTSLFLLKVDGTGPVFFGCYGGLHAIDVGPEGYVVDNNHIVAFTGGLDYNLRSVGGLMGFVRIWRRHRLRVPRARSCLGLHAKPQWSRALPAALPPREVEQLAA